MFPSIDIFKLDGGVPRWIEAAQDFDAAKSRVQILGAKSPGEYVVFNHSTQNKIVIKTGPEIKSQS